MTTKYARAYVAFSSAAQRDRLEFYTARVKNCGRDYDYVALSFYAPEVFGRRLPTGAEFDRISDVGEEARPRTLRRRKIVARQAEAVAARLGWTLTDAERALLDRMATDHTRDGARETIPATL